MNSVSTNGLFWLVIFVILSCVNAIEPFIYSYTIKIGSSNYINYKRFANMKGTVHENELQSEKKSWNPLKNS